MCCIFSRNNSIQFHLEFYMSLLKVREKVVISSYSWRSSMSNRFYCACLLIFKSKSWKRIPLKMLRFIQSRNQRWPIRLWSSSNSSITFMFQRSNFFSYNYSYSTVSLTLCAKNAQPSMSFLSPSYELFLSKRLRKEITLNCKL